MPEGAQRAAIVIEGGGMRGVFSAGVLDCFLDHGHDPFELYLGVSAGACNLSSHLAGQRGRNLRIYTGLMCDPALFSLRRFALGGSYMDLDGLWRAFQREDPLDLAAAVRATHGRGRRFLAVCTSAATGAPRYLEPEEQSWYLALKASSTIPPLCRPAPVVDGEPLVDGGVADALPVLAAVQRGARRVLVVRSRPVSYRKRELLEPAVLSLAFGRAPALRRAVLGRSRAYQRSLELIAHPPAGITVEQLAPPRPLRSSRTTQDRAALLADYELGVEVARAYLLRGALGA